MISSWLVSDETRIAARYDAVVVGGGHNGLVAAAYLARAGQSVLVLERQPALGGAAVSEQVFSGVDAQLSRYAYLVSLFPRAIARDLDLSFVTRRRSIASCTPYERAGVANALILSNVDDERSRRSFEALAGPADWRGYCQLLALERALAERVWPSLLEPLRSRAAWKAALASPEERQAWEALVELPVGDGIERLVADDLARGLIFTDAKIGLFTYPTDPSLLQNRCFLLHVVGQGTGEWQVPVGGMGSLVASLVRSATKAGAGLLTDAEVAAIHPGGPNHSVVFRLAGDERERTVDATRVLVNAGPQVFDRLLGKPFTAGSADEGSVAKVNFLLRRLPRLKTMTDPTDAFRGTFHVDESYEQMRVSYRQAAAGNLPERPPFECYCHTLTDDSILGPALRQAGYQTLTLFGLDVPYRLFEADNDALRRELLRCYLRGLNQHLDEPIEECLAVDGHGQPCLEIKTAVDLERELGLNRGNIFHAAPSWFFADDPDQSGRWGVETAFDRIYRCGASAARGGGVSGIPGRNAAQCIFQELGLTGRLPSAG
jgi:phytoene dehydrogenase-like protein